MILPNIVAAGIFDSRIARKNAKISKKRKTTMFEIELPIEKGGISYIDSDSASIEPGLIISAKPNQLRHTKFPFRCYYIHMILPQGKLYEALQNTADFFQTDQYEKYEKIFAELISYYNSLSAQEEILLQSLVLKLIYNIVKDGSSEYSANRSVSTNPVIENAIRYIDEHLSEHITLENVAEAVSLSPIYFHNSFKFSVGKTLREYVEERRLRKAIHLLQTTNGSLTEIAYECGFSSQSYFSFVFKRKMKKTPRQYVSELYSKYEL